MSEQNLRLYSKFADVPDEAKKEIKGGRLSGMTDINPMWRIKTLTEQFGPCGIGWRYEIKEKQIIDGADGAKAAFVDILLFYRDGESWSDGIPGTGGSMFIAKETKGLYTDDECFKKALTDAISVAAKALGVGASVYFSKDASKYGNSDSPEFIASLEAAQELERLWVDVGHDKNKLPPSFEKRYGVSVGKASLAQLRKAIKDLNETKAKQERQVC